MERAYPLVACVLFINADRADRFFQALESLKTARNAIFRRCSKPTRATKNTPPNSCLVLFFVLQVKKSKFREPGGSKKKKNDAVAAGTGEVVKAELVERPREYIVTLHFPEARKGVCG